MKAEGTSPVDHGETGGGDAEWHAVTTASRRDQGLGFAVHPDDADVHYDRPSSVVPRGEPIASLSRSQSLLRRCRSDLLVRQGDDGRTGRPHRRSVMTEYLIYFNQQWVGDHTEEWFRATRSRAATVVDDIEAAGELIFAGGLEEAAPRPSAPTRPAAHSRSPTGPTSRPPSSSAASPSWMCPMRRPPRSGRARSPRPAAGPRRSVSSGAGHSTDDQRRIFNFFDALVTDSKPLRLPVTWTHTFLPRSLRPTR